MIACKRLFKATFIRFFLSSAACCNEKQYQTTEKL